MGAREPTHRRRRSTNKRVDEAMVDNWLPGSCLSERSTVLRVEADFVTCTQ